VLRADVASAEAAATIVAALAANSGLEQLSLGGPVPEQLLAMIAMRCGKNGAAAAGPASPLKAAPPPAWSPAGGRRVRPGRASLSLSCPPGWRACWT
jgi:hypothetical protein